MTDIAEPKRKLPELEPETAFFWQSGADGRLRIQRCENCRRYQQPPWPRCSSCGSENVTPEVVSGDAHVKTYTINHQAWLPGLKVPFVFAVVELVEQEELYLHTNILTPVDQVKIGMPVSVIFEQHEYVYLPMFQPTEGADG